MTTDKKPPFVVVVCGSRKFGEELPALRSTLSQLISERLGELPGNAVVITGGAIGVDRMADREAGDLGLDRLIMPANWRRHNRQAGYIRNVAMLDFNPDVVLAYRYPGASSGTDMTIKEARRRGIEVEVYELRLNGKIEKVQHETKREEVRGQ